MPEGSKIKTLIEWSKLQNSLFPKSHRFYFARPKNVYFQTWLRQNRRGQIRNALNHSCAVYRGTNVVQSPELSNKMPDIQFWLFWMRILWFLRCDLCNTDVLINVIGSRVVIEWHHCFHLCDITRLIKTVRTLITKSASQNAPE